MTTKLKIFLCLIFTMLLLTGCCRHQWQEATCMAPKTCARCGETEGKIRAHKWNETDCASAQGCVYCGTLEGIELTHQWRTDTRICSTVLTSVSRHSRCEKAADVRRSLLPSAACDAYSSSNWLSIS